MPSAVVSRVVTVVSIGMSGRIKDTMYSMLRAALGIRYPYGTVFASFALSSIDGLRKFPSV